MCSLLFFFKQKTAYEMRISDWSSDVCSSDLLALDLLGIGHLLDRMPATLSGGEAQRVAIGRALLSGPRFLLMDEPLASVDAARRGEILPLIERLRDELAMPILHLRHDPRAVARPTHRILPVHPPTSAPHPPTRP